MHLRYDLSVIKTSLLIPLLININLIVFKLFQRSVPCVSNTILGTVCNDMDVRKDKL